MTKMEEEECIEYNEKVMPLDEIMDYKKVMLLE
jgi:hypothetical protein